jgi:hypothetical protein
MGWFGERKAAFRAAVRERQYVLPSLTLFVAAIAGIVVGQLQEMGLDLNPVLPYLVGLFVVAIFLVFIILEDNVKLRNTIRGTRTDLSILREEGVGIRNRGVHPFKDEVSWTNWRESADHWSDKTIEKIREVNEADAVWFRTLDVVPPPRLEMYGRVPGEPWLENRKKRFQELDFQVKRLGEMIRELWRD